jgi:hypothetical protein
MSYVAVVCPCLVSFCFLIRFKDFEKIAKKREDEEIV